MDSTSFILTYRHSGDPARRANLATVLSWLEGLGLAEVILVEQDAAPGLDDLERFDRLRTVFVHNPGPFNKSWGFNVGWRLARGSVLAFGDADLLCRGVRDAVAAVRSGVPVVRPFTTVLDLDDAQAALLRADLSCLTDPGFCRQATPRQVQGEVPPLCGGLVLFARAFFTLLGGWDERFLGWGGEDDAMEIKVRRAQLRHATLRDMTCLHLPHRRAVTDPANDPLYRNNLRLLDQLRAMPEEALHRMCEISLQIAGNPNMHRPPELLS
ncbi:MAG: galactosyltransferase-related protein [Acetobacteraceae bacterium]|nr:galactosyltransferase-related protein [Acetobacteraceae bacterium]